MFFKIDVLKNLEIFTGKHLYLINNIAGLKVFNKKRLQYRFFPVNNAKFLRTAFL